MAPIKVKQNSWWARFVGTSGSGVSFASDTDRPQQRLLQPAFMIRKLVYFRVKDRRKLEDSEHDIRMTDCLSRVPN